MIVVDFRTCQKVIPFIPKRLRNMIKGVVFSAWEAYEWIFVTRDPLIPPRSLRTTFCVTTNVEDYRNAGEGFLRTFIRYCGITPDDKVLEIGSGCGRIAIPLIQFLSPLGSYDGLEIQKEGYQWCRDTITNRYPNFRFTYSDIHNKDYNPEGALKASEYRFPYPDKHFDFVFMTSVFTHMLPGDMKHYLAEIFRVLKTDGRCLMTFFLWNHEVKLMHDSGKSPLRFVYDMGDLLTIDRDTPELAIAYREEDILSFLNDAGFQCTGAPLYGSWCGRTGTVSGQDIIIVRR